ncbi:MAG: thioredoxin-dependent thiol peroxidase [Polyangiales bacterium]
MPLAVGDAAPDFTAQTDDGEVSLSGLKGKTVVLYFYPKDNTSGCTREACDFRDNQTKFKRKGVVVLGVSPDSVKSHQGFKTKHELNFPLVADPERTIANAYGVYREKNMYGKKTMGIERTTFVIDGKGKVAAIYPKVKVDGHVAAILEALPKA